MDEHFLKEYLELRDEALLKLNSVFYDRIREIGGGFSESLRAACDQVIKMQKQGYREIEYLEFTLLRTRLLNRDYHMPVMVYGEDWYADLNQAQVGTIDMDPIFSFYDELADKTERLVKKYRTKIPQETMAERMCLSAEYFFHYVGLALRHTVMGFTAGEMKITDEFRIRCCEYMGRGQVLRRHTPHKDMEQLKKWFGKKEKEVYRFRDFSGRDFSGWDLEGMDLTGCDFRKCNLSGCNLSGADLTGTWFCDSEMRGADLSGAWVPGARFDRADLTDATLEDTYCVCRINRGAWLRPDNIRPSFADACFKGADLSFSMMDGADFTGAALDGAQFSEGHGEYYRLSREQIKAAVFEEDGEEEDGDE